MLCRTLDGGAPQGRAQAMSPKLLVHEDGELGFTLAALNQSRVPRDPAIRPVDSNQTVSAAFQVLQPPGELVRANRRQSLGRPSGLKALVHPAQLHSIRRPELADFEV